MVNHLDLPFDECTNLGSMETTLKLTAKIPTNSHILHNAFEDDSFNQGSSTAHLFVLDCK